MSWSVRRARGWLQISVMIWDRSFSNFVSQLIEGLVGCGSSWLSVALCDVTSRDKIAERSIFWWYTFVLLLNVFRGTTALHVSVQLTSLCSSWLKIDWQRKFTLYSSNTIIRDYSIEQRTVVCSRVVDKIRMFTVVCVCFLAERYDYSCVSNCLRWFCGTLWIMDVV